MELQPQPPPQHSKPSLDYRRATASFAPPTKINNYMPYDSNRPIIGDANIDEEDDEEDDDDDDEESDEVIEPLNVSTASMRSATIPYPNTTGLRKRNLTTASSMKQSSAATNITSATATKSKSVRFKHLPNQNVDLIRHDTDHLHTTDIQQQQQQRRSDAIARTSAEFMNRSQHRQLYRRNVTTKLKKIVFNGTFPIDDPYSSRFDPHEIDDYDLDDGIDDREVAE